MDGILQRLGLKEGEAIVHAWINKALEKAQQKVEARNFEIRKNLLRYDDVMNDQRKVIYEQRKELMRVTDVSDTLAEMRQEVIEGAVRRCIPENAYAEQWDTKGLHEECLRLFGLDLPIADWAKEEGIADKEIEDRIRQAVDRKMAEKAANYGPQVMRVAERSILLQLLDQAWKDHLLQLDHLRHGIGLRAYAQRDPLNEYKREAFDLFEQMLTHLREQVTAMMAHLEIRLAEAPPAMPQRAPQRMMESREDPALVPAGGDSLPERPAGAAVQRATRAAAPAGAAAGDMTQPGKVQRNAPCPCGSGKKYKHCHGKI
jgi:preprotein translocase subunit SecA